jgi:hypothetical protein
MKLPLERKAAIIILLLLIFLFVSKGIEFMHNRHTPLTEMFADKNTQTFATCQCLPGHIPYQTKDQNVVCLSMIDGKSTKSCF